MPKDYYIVLGVSRDAALVKIKRAYRKAVKRYHPDVTSSREGAEKFKKIKEAYETLRNEEKRRRYDKELARERSPFRITEVPSLVRRRTSLFDEIDTYKTEIKLSMEDIGLRGSCLNITVLIDPTLKEEW